MRRVSAFRAEQAGFTMVELIIVIVLLGILSVSVLPRLSGSNEFRTVQLRDEVTAALRFAQKTAVSHRRRVCVNVVDNVLSLQIAETHLDSSICNLPLAIPGGSSTVGVSGVNLSVTPATLIIQPSGQVIGNNSTKYEFLIANGEYKITLWAETGHVE